MRLVSESTCQRNPSQSLPPGCHHEFGGLDSSSRDTRHGRGCKALFTRASKTGEPANCDDFILDGEPSRILPSAALHFVERQWPAASHLKRSQLMAMGEI
jgi:hypothetical protein